MGSEEVNGFLTHLAVKGQVSASSRNQVLSALLFLYRELLERDLGLEGVITVAEVRCLECPDLAEGYGGTPSDRLGADESPCTGGVGLAMGVSTARSLAPA
jgi:hypothetical protein